MLPLRGRHRALQARRAHAGHVALACADHHGRRTGCVDDLAGHDCHRNVGGKGQRNLNKDYNLVAFENRVAFEMVWRGGAQSV